MGYDEAGQLTEKIRRKPYAVVLFDEIEKAHPDVLNILLQILDDGEITDAHGRKVNFENTIIVMTSNAGSETNSGPLGFGKTTNELNKDKAMKALQQFLRPEFINRVDAVICFNQLSEENFRSIARIMLQELQDVLQEKKNLTFSLGGIGAGSAGKGILFRAYGARNLRRYIQKHLEDPIASQIIDSYLHPITALKAVVEDGKIVIHSPVIRNPLKSTKIACTAFLCRRFFLKGTIISLFPGKTVPGSLSQSGRRSPAPHLRW